MAKKTEPTYIPPFTVTDEITSLVADIAEVVGHLSATAAQLPTPQLRKKNRIKTIQSSLAIENNSMTIEQVTAIVDGKRVLGPPNEIQEVKNAIDAYELLFDLDPFKAKDLLKAHKLMMADLVNENGKFRQGGVGVFDRERCVHLAPPAGRVPILIADLFDWVKTTKVHPLISSCVFHYEFEFIHPFIDGNGRMGRFWQTMLLSRWKGIFAWLPVETIVKEHQQEYYNVIARCDAAGESCQFVEFMLRCLLDAMEKYEDVDEEVQDKVQNKVQDKFPEVSKPTWDVYDIIHKNPKATVTTICEQLGLKERQVYKHISILKSLGIIVRVGSNKTGYWKTNL
jgi:Fic family protein